LPSTHAQRSGHWRCGLFIALAVLVTWIAPPTVRADDVADEADVQFRLGSAEYHDGNFELALSYFLASNRLARNKNVLFNIARCYEQLQRFPEAYRYYSGALENEKDASAIAILKQALSGISNRVALLAITTDPPGARIYLDRKDLGERGLAPQTIALPARSYRVIAELEGYEDATSAPVGLKIGARPEVALVLRKIVGTLSVTGVEGAAVRLDADNTPELCRTPCDVQTAPGQHLVILSKPGARTSRSTVLVKAGESSRFVAELEVETGSLVVEADEAGAAIDVDGVAQGFTPAVLKLPAGRHHVVISRRGFRAVARDVLVRENQQQTLQVELFSSDLVEAASRVIEPVESAPASVSIIGSQELRAMRYPTVFEALRGTRGVFVGDDRLYQTLGFRGFNRLGSYGNRVLVTLDGTPMNDDWIWSSYVGFDLRTDLDDIDHIEIVRGPGSVLYGTSAFSGVVNLVTRASEVPTSNEAGISLAADGAARVRARVTRHLGASAGFWTSLAAGKSAGQDFFFPEYAADGPPNVAGVARGIDGAKFGTWAGRVWWGGLALNWSLHHHTKQQPTGQYDTLFGDGRTYSADTRGLVELRFEQAIGAAITSLTRVTGNVYDYTGDYARSPEDEGVENNSYRSFWAVAEQRFVITPLSAISLSIGAEGQVHPDAAGEGSTETAGRYIDVDQSFSLGAVYGSLELRPFSWLELSAGGRLDYYSTFGSSFNPRLALIAQPWPGGNLKLMAGKAFKAPSVYEVSYTYIGQLPNPALQPENIYSAEVELSQRLTPTLTLTLAAYANYIEDLISLENADPSPDGTENTQFRNTDTPVGALGAELEVRRDWKEGWMLSASYSFQQSRYLASDGLRALTGFERSADLREVPNSPQHLASFKGALPLFGRALTFMNRLSFEGPRFDRNDADDAGVLQTQVASSLSWDIVLSGQVARWGVSYSFGVYNAFDSRGRYPVSDELRQLSIPMLGRSLLAAATLTY